MNYQNFLFQFKNFWHFKSLCLEKQKNKNDDDKIGYLTGIYAKHPFINELKIRFLQIMSYLIMGMGLSLDVLLMTKGMILQINIH